MRTAPKDARFAFVGIWCAIVVGTALVAAGGYLSLTVHGTSLLSSAGVFVYLISSRALRQMFGAATFASGATRVRALVGFAAFITIGLGAIVALFTLYLVARSSLHWWNAPLSAAVFLGLLGASVVSYRTGVDYPKRYRPSEPETTKGADASHPRPVSSEKAD